MRKKKIYCTICGKEILNKGGNAKYCRPCFNNKYSKERFYREYKINWYKVEKLNSFSAVLKNMERVKHGDRNIIPFRQKEV